jgi:hypothetical protein
MKTKLQVLYLVSLREQRTSFSLAQLYRSCTDMPTLTGDDDDGYDDKVEVVKKDKGRKNRKRSEGREDESNKGFDVLTDPIEDLGKAEFVPLHRAVDECVCVQALDLDVKAVASQEDIGGGESDALVAVDEAVIVAERLHQRSRFFFDGVVIAGLRTKNGGLNSSLVADTMETAEHLDQSMLHPVDFRYGKKIRHLLGETLQQVTIASNRLLEGIHHLGADQVLGRNHVVQVEPERLFENIPLRLPILLRNRGELIVKLSVNLRSELLGDRGWHGLPPPLFDPYVTS